VRHGMGDKYMSVVFIKIYYFPALSKYVPEAIRITYMIN
jgi:hypothetical protein